DEINKVNAGGEGKWALSGAMAGLFTDEEVHKLLKYDPEQSKKLLAEAGYANGVTLEFPIDSGNRSQSDKTLFELVQAQLKRVGINVNINVVDTNLQRQKRRAGDFGLDGTTGLSPLEADNDSILFGEFYSALSASTNYSKINDPELDKLLRAERAEANPDKRKDLLKAAGTRIAENVYEIGLIYGPKWDAVQP